MIGGILAATHQTLLKSSSQCCCLWLEVQATRGYSIHPTLFLS
jgi:hypothetical protein